MKACSLFSLFVFALLTGYGLSGARKQNAVQSQKPENSEKQTAQLKRINSPTPIYPDEALRKNVEGKVVLSIVVDAQGKVSDAKALSGLPELFQAAIDSVKQWEFEPPPHAPVATTAEVGYGSPEECPGAISDSAEVIAPAWLKSGKGTVISSVDFDQPLPPYLTADRKASVAGEMILSIAVNAEGKVEKVHIVKSLSPRLDKAAIKTVHTWKFRLIDGSSDALPDDFQVHITYRTTCKVLF
jgi:TonB family protein